MKALLAQETDLLIGRHLDQLVMCTIYGVCRVHPGCINKPNAGLTVLVMFNDIIDAYGEVNRISQNNIGQRLSNLQKSVSVSWVYVEVPIDI